MSKRKTNEDGNVSLSDTDDFGSDEESKSEEKLKKEEAPKEPEVEAEALLKTKRARYSKPFNEELLLGSDGIDKIYAEFPYLCKPQGSEVAFLSRLIANYQEWAFKLHPGLSFQDIVSKCEQLGTKGKVRSSIQRMRDRERDRYIDQVLFPALEKRNNNNVIDTTKSSFQMPTSSSSSSSSSSAAVAPLVTHLLSSPAQPTHSSSSLMDSRKHDDYSFLDDDEESATFQQKQDQDHVMTSEQLFSE